ncbi:MAG: undecaprenyl-diphosphatase, partial [Spirochaetes bacterium]
FIVTGLFLLLTLLFKGNRNYRQMSIWNAMVIGFFQGIGVLPGISRSGITITASLGSKMDRKYAGEFSFLIAIPAILGALFLKSGETQSLLNTVSLPVIAVGFIVTFIVGLLSLLLLLKLIKSGKLYIFSFYLIPLGIVTLLKAVIFR